MTNRLQRYDKKLDRFLPAETKDLRKGDIIRILPSEVNRVVAADAYQKVSPLTGKPAWHIDVQTA